MSSPPPLVPGERVFLTGGTGLVGSHVAAVLREQGYSVRALCRPNSRSGFLRELGCDVIEGSLEGGASALIPSMEGCSAVVHAAATLYSDLPWDRVREVNVAGTRGVFEGARTAGIRRGVHLSSVTVYGDPRGLIDEESATDSPLRPSERYALSKRESELAVREVSEGTDLAVAVLRPSAIYGERDRLLTPKLMKTLRFPIHLVLGDGNTVLPAIYAGNLAHAVLAALRGELKGGVRPFNVADDVPVTQRALLHGLASALGIPFRPFPLPRELVLAGARVAEMLRGWAPDAAEVPLRRAAWLAVTPSPFQSRRIREELGWVPPYSLAEALARTAQWVQIQAGTRESRTREG